MIDRLIKWVVSLFGNKNKISKEEESKIALTKEEERLKQCRIDALDADTVENRILWVRKFFSVLEEGRDQCFTGDRVMEILESRGNILGENERKFYLFFSLEDCYCVHRHGRGCGTGVDTYDIIKELKDDIQHVRFWEEEGGFFAKDKIWFQYVEAPIDYMTHFQRTY